MGGDRIHVNLKNSFSKVWSWSKHATKQTVGTNPITLSKYFDTWHQCYTYNGLTRNKKTLIMTIYNKFQTDTDRVLNTEMQ
jgi:hypothetical protein